MRSVILRIAFVVITMLTVALPAAATGVRAQGENSTPAPANEAVSRSFDFYPAATGWGTSFEPVVEVGETAELKVLLGNTGSITQELRTYAVNADTAEGGGLRIAEDGSNPNDVTNWLNFPENVYTLESGKGVEISLSVTVPDDASPGEYVTALAAEHATASEIEGSEMFTQKLRYIIPVFITVPGDMQTAFEIGNVSLKSSSGGLVAEIPIVNSGDTHVRLEGTMQLSNEDGQLLASVPLGPTTIFSGDSATNSQSIPQNLPSSTFQARIELTDPDSGVSVTRSFDNLVAQSPATPAPPPPIAISSATVEPKPPADDVQFAVVEATISNTAEPIDAQLSLLSYRDGEQVERFPISQSLSVPQGETPVTTRYIPLDGWTSGEWTFELLLETVDPATGAAVVIDSQPIEGAITIP